MQTRTFNFFPISSKKEYTGTLTKMGSLDLQHLTTSHLLLPSFLVDKTTLMGV
jgi:hypothetical protein